MVRIFLGLSVVALALLIANLFVGLSAGDLQAVSVEFQQELHAYDQLTKSHSKDAPALAEAKERLLAARERYQAVSRPMTLHLLLGSAAALVTVLVNSIAITYFIGTSRWCKEVSETFRLDPTYALQGAALKRQATPWAILGILSILGVIALGAAADARGANHERSAAFVMPHYLAAVVAIVAIGVGFAMQAQKMLANHQLIDDVMTQVQRVREERKLASSAAG